MLRRLLFLLIVVTAALAAQPVRSWVPRSGPRASRPTKCTRGDVWVCVGNDCGTEGTYDYCRAQNTWVPSLGRDTVSIKDFGAVGDGVTDDSTAFSNALSALYTAGGGTLYVPEGTYLITGALSIPNDGQSLPAQPPLRIIGDGASVQTPEGTAALTPNGGTILDLRYSGGNPAIIDTRGKGLLEIANLTIFNGHASNSLPFIQTTNTALKVHDVAFYGRVGLAGQTCNQDAILLGSTTTTIDGTADAPFQGYGTVIERNHFYQIRRGVFLRTYANGVVIRDNTWWVTSGAADTTTAAIDTDTSAGAPILGTVISGNLFESAFYPWTIHFDDNVNYSTIIGNGFFDPVSSTTSYIRFDSLSNSNYVAGNLISPAAGYPATIIDDQNGTNSMYPGKPRFYDDTPYNISSPSYQGSGGLNDVSSGGIYTGTSVANYCVKISSTGTPDKITWGTNLGTCNNLNSGTEVDITGAAQALTGASAISVTFVATTGHTLNDTWNIKATNGGSTKAIIRAGYGQSGNTFEIQSYAGSATTIVPESTSGFITQAFRTTATPWLGYGTTAAGVSIDYFVNGIQLDNTRPIGWSSTGGAGETADLGIKRNSAGVMKVTDGSTGTGTTITKLPTSCSGLVAGTLYNNTGTPAICP